MVEYFIKLRSTFDKFDTNHSETIDRRELFKCLQELDLSLPTTIAQKLIKRFAKDLSREIDFRDFTQMTLFLQKLKREFNNVDVDKNKYLDASEIQAVLRALDIQITVVEADLFLKLLNIDNLAGLNFEQFVDLLFKYNEHGKTIAEEARKLRRETREKAFLRPITMPKLESEKVKKVINQMAAKVIEECKASGKKWEDPDFPASNASLFPFEPNRLHTVHSWKRPDEISPNAVLISDGTQQGDVKQGSLGNCWFLSSLCVVAQAGEAFIDELFVNKYPEYGFYQCRFFKNGEWKIVMIDDRIPTNSKGKISFASCRDPNEFWVPLLEKAYAKLHGNYGATDSGNICDALVDLCGESSETVEIEPSEKFWNLLKNNMTESYLMGCSISDLNSSAEEPTPLGLLKNHAYGVLEVIDRDDIKLVRVRNPYVPIL
eukprot:TRINITY_DN2629_c0_g1_i2.p1 TRINITY_DN2629_c0_g1~~TRINITY_DN2629_c0_g1_i2.p1  ORF type:complete len:440 (-),score=71.84 TRINITY_DN2629_c0_g1_i2:1442-2737(-)